MRGWTRAQWQRQTSNIILHICAKRNTMPRPLQMSKPALNTTWTMEMDPTNALFSSLTSANAMQSTTHHSISSEQYNSDPATLHSRLQPTVSNGCISSITADCTTSQMLCPPLPSSVQFDNNSEGDNLLKPTVNGKPCILWYDIKRINKTVERISDGLCKAAIVSKSQVLWWWLAWTIWPSSGLCVRHGTQKLQRIRNWNKFKLVVWNAQKD